MEILREKEPTGRDEYRAVQLVLHSQKQQQQKLFPSSVSRSGSSEASVQIQTTALRPQSLRLNWPLTRRQHEALVFPQKGVRSLQLFLCPLVLVQTQQTFRRLTVDSTDEIKSSDAVWSRAAFSEIDKTLSEAALKPKSGTFKLQQKCSSFFWRGDTTTNIFFTEVWRRWRLQPGQKHYVRKASPSCF